MYDMDKRWFWEFWRFSIGLLIFATALSCIIAPILIPILILEIFIIEKISKKIRTMKQEVLEKKQMELNFIQQGYRKICDKLFVNQNTNKVNIEGKDYDFSQIIDCNLVAINQPMNNTYGRVNTNSKLYPNLNTFSVGMDYCTQLYINITINDLNNPNIKLDFKGDGVVSVSSGRYKDAIEGANNALSILKVIINQNNMQKK